MVWISNRRRHIIHSIYRYFISLFIMLLFFQCHAFGEQIIKISSNQQFNYAEQLFSQKNYSSAVFEYQRFVHFFPNDDKKEQAVFQIGMAYYNEKKYENSINAFNLLIENFSNYKEPVPDLFIKAYFMISETYIKQKAQGQAIAVLHNLIMLTNDKNIQNQCFYKIGWIYLESSSWDKARFFFNKISPENKDKYRLQTLSAELNQIHKIPSKNPALTGILSIIPGAGFLYCNRYRDALTAFLFNGGLMLAAYKAFDDDNPALGSVISLVELGFYTGNFYGAVSSAHKYNRNSNKRFLDRVKEKTQVRLSLDQKDKEIILSFDYDF